MIVYVSRYKYIPLFLNNNIMGGFIEGMLLPYKEEGFIHALSNGYIIANTVYSHTGEMIGVSVHAPEGTIEVL